MSQVLIVAAEASSALFAQRLLEHWKLKKFSVNAFGVGSQSMQDLGFERLGKSEDMAVVGVAEIIEHYSALKKVMNDLVQAATDRRPDLAIIMDYPDFNLMLAKKLKAIGIPVVYYITPQVWAWRKSRVKKIKKYCDEVLVLFPFEVPFFESEGIKTSFVGHPLLDEVSDAYLDPTLRHQARSRCGIQDDEIVLGLMPGSRKHEIKHHLATQLAVAENIYKSWPKVKVLLMCAPTVDKESLKDQLSDLRIPLILQKEDPVQMIHLTDVVLAASGTATLFVALLEKPMVIMYKMKWTTWVLAKMLVRGVRFFGIVNLILGYEAVPERWQAQASVKELSLQIKKYLSDPEYREKVISDLKKVKASLGEKGATARVADKVSVYFKGST